MTITAHEAIARFSQRLLLRGVSLLDIEIAAGGVLRVLMREDLNAWSKRVAVRALGPIEDETP